MSTRTQLISATIKLDQDRDQDMDPNGYEQDQSQDRPDERQILSPLDHDKDLPEQVQDPPEQVEEFRDSDYTDQSQYLFNQGQVQDHRDKGQVQERRSRPEYKVTGLYVMHVVVCKAWRQIGQDKDLSISTISKNIFANFESLFQCPPEEKVGLLTMHFLQLVVPQGMTMVSEMYFQSSMDQTSESRSRKSIYSVVSLYCL
ncbi:uncharacterized protein LOC120328375 [Styela clava]